VRVAILGGTGAFGTALARRLVDAGHDVVIGSRDLERAAAAASELGSRAAGATNADSLRDVDLAVLATKAEAALDTARELRTAIGKTPVLSVASELRFTSGGVFPSSSAVSLAERVQAELDAPVVAGLHSLAASTLGGEEPPDEDTLVCGDDADAKALALELAAGLVTGRTLDAGPLASARALEGLTAVIINLNKRYRGHAGIRVTGLP
jgi:8-hydroxy-5-deazaflavin:NADPH oxidoreductase